MCYIVFVGKIGNKEVLSWCSTARVRWRGEVRGDVGGGGGGDRCVVLGVWWRGAGEGRGLGWGGGGVRDVGFYCCMCVS